MTSESIGSYSGSRKLTSGLTPWLDEYQALIERVRSPRVSLTTLDSNGIERDDTTMERLKNDQAWVAQADDADQPNPPTLKLSDLYGAL